MCGSDLCWLRSGLSTNGSVEWLACPTNSHGDEAAVAPGSARTSYASDRRLIHNIVQCPSSFARCCLNAARVRFRFNDGEESSMLQFSPRTVTSSNITLLPVWFRFARGRCRSGSNAPKERGGGTIWHIRL